MKKNIFVFIFVVFILTFILISNINFYNEEKVEKGVYLKSDNTLSLKEEYSKEEYSKEEELNMDDALAKAFQEGYINGKNSFLSQFRDEYHENFSFTTHYENLSEEQKNKLEEVWHRGYVEGYHRADQSCSRYQHE